MRALIFFILALAASAPKVQPTVFLTGNAEEKLTVYGDISMGLFSTISRKCKVLSHAKITIITPPQHGKLTVSLKNGNVRFDDGHYLASCNGTKIIGRMVEYDRNKDDTNEDFFSYRIVFANGETRVIHYRALPKG